MATEFVLRSVIQISVIQDCISAPGGNRTPDLDVRTVLLYPLSYGGGTLGSLLSAP